MTDHLYIRAAKLGWLDRLRHRAIGLLARGDAIVLNVAVGGSIFTRNGQRGLVLDVDFRTPLQASVYLNCGPDREAVSLLAEEVAILAPRLDAEGRL